jgi:hypothetical protein
VGWGLLVEEVGGGAYWEVYLEGWTLDSGYYEGNNTEKDNQDFILIIRIKERVGKERESFLLA